MAWVGGVKEREWFREVPRDRKQGEMEVRVKVREMSEDRQREEYLEIPLWSRGRSPPLQAAPVASLAQLPFRVPALLINHLDSTADHLSFAPTTLSSHTHLLLLWIHRHNT